MDRSVASYLDHARRTLAAGRLDEAAGLERQALLIAEGLPDGRAERAAVLALRADRLVASGDRPGALAAVLEALPLTTDGAAAYRLRLEEGRLRLATGDAEAARTIEALVADGRATGVAPWPMARAYALLARLREHQGDEPAARAAEARGREHLGDAPDPPASLVAALGGAPAGGEGAPGGTDRAPRRSWDDDHPDDPRGPRATASPPVHAHRPPRPARPTPPPATSPPPTSRTVDEPAFSAVLADLDALVGLADVKRQVRRTAQLLRMRALREAAGLRAADVSLHLVFDGGPGTGKTTVARLFGRLYRALGLLATDRVVEVDRSGLVAGYVGKTAEKVNAAVDSALDGVLFVDEAYALAGGGPNDFGQEAISTLLKRMEDDRHRLAVICAGYTVEMEEFLASNSGLASRFSETIRFADYGPDELVAILERFCAASDYLLETAARAAAAAVLAEWHEQRDATFANARTVRNLFDDLIAAQADRLLTAEATPDAAAMRRLTAADVEAAAG